MVSTPRAPCGGTSPAGSCPPRTARRATTRTRRRASSWAGVVEGFCGALSGVWPCCPPFPVYGCVSSVLCRTCSISPREPLRVDVLVGPVRVDREQRFVDPFPQRTAFPHGDTNFVGPEYRADDLQHPLAALRDQVLNDRGIEHDGLYLALREHSDSLVGIRHACKRQSKPGEIVAGNRSRRGGNRLARQVSRTPDLRLEASHYLRRRHRRRELGDQDDAEQP